MSKQRTKWNNRTSKTNHNLNKRLQAHRTVYLNWGSEPLKNDVRTQSSSFSSEHEYCNDSTDKNARLRWKSSPRPSVRRFDALTAKNLSDLVVSYVTRVLYVTTQACVSQSFQRVFGVESYFSYSFSTECRLFSVQTSLMCFLILENLNMFLLSKLSKIEFLVVNFAYVKWSCGSEISSGVCETYACWSTGFL